MLAIAFLSVVLLYADSASVKNDCVYPGKVGNQADYYWRDYFGIIPNDAVLGGYRSDGNVTYIGQLQRQAHAGLFPGTIYPGQKEGVVCPVAKYTDATYVKILCGNPQYKFEWIKTTADESQLFTDYHMIIGGQEQTILTYIGRVNFEGEVQVGRVFESKSPHKGLWICNKAGSQVNFFSFELLVVAR